jgi:S1-C subfamily serine protease
MNLVDLGVLVLAGLGAWRGWRRGFISQLFEFGGGFLGLLAGVFLGPRIADAFAENAGAEAALISIATVFVMLSVGQALGFVAGHRFSLIAQRAKLGSADAGMGAALSVAVTLISFWLIGSLLIQGPSKGLAKALQKSTALSVMNDVMPAPPDVLAYIRQYLDTSGFPQVFSGLPRPVGPPVKLPSDAEARAAGEKAEDSVARILVPACGGTQLGSGWIAAPETVVTNAHVVSGGDDVTIQHRPTGDHSATVVLFDPKTDIAILHVEGLQGPVLDLETAMQERGTKGAALGYPGNRDGELVILRAAVQAQYPATGKDIYGRSEARREVYELRAKVRQGDSGGPFVLSNGDVAGVVFAASTTDGGIGYALTGAEVQDEIEAGANRTDPVGTGRCTH